MNWQSVLNPQTYRSILRERLWRSAEHVEQTTEFTWPFDRTAAAETQISWPSSFEWPIASKWMCSLSTELQKHSKLTRREIPQPWKGITHFKVERADRQLSVTVDYSDYPEIENDALAQSDLYFKMQYAIGGYASEKVLPGGFVVNDQSIYQYLDPLRRRSQHSTGNYVYGRFNPEFGQQSRKRAIALLDKQTSFKYLGGAKTVRYSQYLTESAQAGICLDLPGQGELCFRLIDYMAIGCCVVTPRKIAEFPEPLIEGENIIYCKRDLSDLVEICEGLLKSPEKRKEIGKNAANYFDTYLHREQLASYYLSKILQRLE